MTAPAIFLDKDGTLVENVPFNVDPDRVRLADGAADALVRLQAAGFRFAVISNQPGVALGLFPERALDTVAVRLRALLGVAGVQLLGFFYCPHHPDGRVARYRTSCRCRKPAPGLVRRAAGRLGADLERSWVVGDILDDVEAGRRAGCRTVLLDGGGESEWAMSAERTPHFVARSFREVADLILAAHEHVT
jgi:D-glycero-D-manno-heptose 1,7-bisphosphate phosphatase